MASPRRILLLLLLIPVACQSTKKARLVEHVETPDVSERELRLRMANFLREYMGTIETAADAILADTADPALRDAARRWRMGAISTGVTATFQSDPVAGLLDLWALVDQMMHFFEREAGKDFLGKYQPLALAVTKRLAERMDEFEAYLPGKDGAESRATIESWAREHPLELPFLVRHSPAADLARQIGDPKFSIFGAVESLDERLADLMQRLNFYLLLLPRQLRWQGEAIGEQVARHETMLTTLNDFNVMAASLDRLATIEDRIPDLIERNKDVLMKPIRAEMDGITEKVEGMRVDTLETVKGEREIVLAEVDRQRTETLAAISAERKEVLDAVDRQMETALSAVREERVAVLESVDRQRIHTIAEAERLTDLALEAGETRFEGLIRDFFFGAIIAGAALIVVYFAAKLAYVRLSGRGA